MPDRRQQHRTIGLLDIGSGKIAAAVVVAETGRDGSIGSLRLAGLGLHKSRGVKAGVLTDLDDAEHAVRAALSQAERAAGIGIDSVVVSISCGRLGSQYFTARAEVETGIVSDDDVARAFSGGRAYAERNGRMLVHLNALGFGLDGAGGVQEPRGLAAHVLAAQLHAVTADEAPVRNLLLLIERCRLVCDGLVAAPYASGLAVTTEEERAMGVTCLDFGAGTTSAAVFADGRLLATEVVPVGAQHITFDIAKSLQTPLGEAERIKTLYGTLISAQSDERETFSYALASDEEGASYHATRAQLSAIIRPRVAQMLNLVRERLDGHGTAALPGQQVVLTGGGSQIIGAAEFAAGVLGRPVRSGRPVAVSGVPATGATAPLSTVLGLASAFAAGAIDAGSAAGPDSSDDGYLIRVGSWLKQGF